MSDAQLQAAVDVLGPLAEELVFVGGASIFIWLTEPAAPPVRATVDVDAIAEIHSRGEYYALSEKLRRRGLEEVINEPVVCRWRHPVAGLVLDVMPSGETSLGFTNPWYAHGVESAVDLTLASGAHVRVAPAAALLGMKLAAWLGRGHGDMLRSLDVHDVLVLINGRPELASEVAEQPRELREYLAAELVALTAHNDFDYAIDDAVRGYGSAARERAEVVSARLRAIAERAQEPEAGGPL